MGAWSLSEYKEGFFCLNILEKVKVTFEKATGSVRCPEMVLCRTGQGESQAEKLAEILIKYWETGVTKCTFLCQMQCETRQTEASQIESKEGVL